MRRTIVFLALLASFSSCHKSNGGFNDLVVISPYEEADNKSFNLICHTQKTYSCNTANIFTTAVVNGNDITVAFKYLTLSGCSGKAASETATAVAALGTLGTGTYTLHINNGGQISTGTLIVDSASFTISFTTLNNISFEHTQVMRIPAHTIWGYASYDTTSLQGVANSFVDSFRSIGAQTFIGAPGYYGYFTLADTTITLSSNMPYTHNRTFIYHYPGDLNLVPALVDSFGHHNPGAEFVTWTSSGFFFMDPTLAYLQNTH